MTLHLTRDEWERIAADGEGVLFRAGEPWYYAKGYDGVLNGTVVHPPAEFVEAAQPCETCDGIGVSAYYPYPDCPDCLDGKRRIAVAVPCDFCRGNTPPKNVVAAPCWKCSGQKVLTVGHVVVEWGPLVVYLDTDDRAFRPDQPCVIVGTMGNDAGNVAVWHGDGDFTPITLPPDIDPATLVGQYAICIKVMEP